MVRSLVRIGMFLLAVLPVPGPVRAQAVMPDSSASRVGYGGEVLLTNSGFGLGGYWTRRTAGESTFTFEFNIASAKDEREVAFFDRFGQQDVPNKANYLIEIPIRIGLERRFFRSYIEDNFRPYLHMSAGPVIGWKYPYYSDSNENGVLDEDEPTYDVIGGISRGRPEPGAGGSLAIGANFGEQVGLSQGVRIGYRFNWYKNPIDLLDRQIQEPEHFIGSPFIMIYFGRLSR